MTTQVKEIHCIGGWESVNQENDNVDVHAVLGDGRTYAFVFATPANIYWCMANEGVDHFFGHPPVLVRALTRECVAAALDAIVRDDNGQWLEVYGALQGQ